MHQALLRAGEIQTYDIQGSTQYIVVDIAIGLNLNIQNDHLEDGFVVQELASFIHKISTSDTSLNKHLLYILVFPFSKEFSLKYWTDLICYLQFENSRETQYSLIPIMHGESSDKQSSFTMVATILKYTSEYIAFACSNLVTSPLDSSSVNEPLYASSINMDRILLTLLEKEGLHIPSSSMIALRAHNEFTSQAASREEKEILNQIYAKYENLQDVLNIL